MNREYTIFLLIILLTACAACTPVTAADFQTRSVDTEVAVRSAAVQVRDVTDLYATGTAGMNRASGDYFITVAGFGTDQYPLETILTSDEGAVTVGSNFNDDTASDDALILKYDNTGSVIWARTVGGDEVDIFRSVGEAPDGGYVCAGYSASYGSGEVQVLLVKFSSSGAVQWARTAGGGMTDAADGICIDEDGTIVIGGFTSSYGADGTAVLLMGFNANGTLLWCTMGDAPANDRLLFDSGGGITWASTVGDDCWNSGYDAMETPDGGFLLTGNTTCYDDVSANDVLIARFGPDGTLWWARSLGEHGTAESGWSVAVDTDGNFAIAGGTDDALGSVGDAFLLWFDSNGGLLWARTMGGDEEDTANHVLLLPGGGYLLTGPTKSFGAGGWDVLLAALNEDGLVPGCEHIRTWHISSPLQEPIWSAVTLTETVPLPTVNTLSLTTLGLGIEAETICDYQKPDTEYWLVASGSDETERGQAIGQTPDGGFLAVAEHRASTGNDDVLLLKYDALGNLQWARTAGGPFDESPRGLLVTDDGGCVVVGSTYSFGAGLQDVLILGFDPGGSLLWCNTVGGADHEIAWSIWQRPDGNYMAAGGTSSFGAGGGDILLLEMNPTGTVLSVRTIGTSAHEEAVRGIPLTGGGSLLAGFRHDPPGSQDALAIKVADDGSISWCSQSGSSDVEVFRGAVELTDGDLILGGITQSYGSKDILLVRFSAAGALQWFRTVGTADEEDLFDLKPTPDGGVVGCGLITQTGGDYYDALLCRFDDQAQTLWARRVGGDTSEDFRSLLVTGDDGFAAAGFTSSFGLVSGNVFVTRTDDQGMVSNCPWFSSETFSTSDRFPPSGSYAMTSAAITPSVNAQSAEQSTLQLDYVLLCSALPPTVSAVITSVPSVGTLPFSTWMEVSLANNYDEQIRRVAAQIHITLGNGVSYQNWRAGFTNIGPGEIYSAAWPQNMPALGSLIGENHFHLVAEDVTPAPFNQPPYPPAGDTDTGLQTVLAYAP